MPHGNARFLLGAKWRVVVWAALGCAAALGQAPWGLWPISLLAFAAALILFAHKTSRAGALFGWAFGFGYFATALHWIVYPFLVDPEVHGWMAPFGLLFLSAGLALFWSVAGWIAARLQMGALGFAMMLASAELARSVAFTGFPWAVPGHIWIGTQLAQFASVVGEQGLTLLTLGAAFLLSFAVQQGSRRLVALIPIGLLPLAFFWLEPNAADPLPQPTQTVRLVQPNAPQDEKWDPDFVPVFYGRLLQATAAEPQHDLIVWPETAIPYLMEHAGGVFAEIAQVSQGTPVVLGLNRREGARYYNSLVVTGSGAVPLATYDKRHLVPFGEYVPFSEWFPGGLNGFAASQGGGFSAGTGTARISLPGIGEALPLICYEGIFIRDIREALSEAARPRLILLITNDAWFGPSAGPSQHFAMARLRSIETGLPMIRVANTGVSAVLDGRGQVLASLPLNTQGALDVSLPADSGETLYLRLGNWPANLLLLSLIFWSIWSARQMVIDPRASTD